MLGIWGVRVAEHDPYSGAKTDEERQTIYQELQARYEQSEYERKERIRQSLMPDWDRFREVQLREDRAFCRHIAITAAGFLGASFIFYRGKVPVPGLALFAAALVITAAIHLVSSFIHGAYCDTIAENIQRGYDGEPFRPMKKWFSGWLMRALYAADFAAFTGGLLFLVLDA
jgi:hypothetical protein